MKIKLIAALMLTCLCISSCIKDEAPNMECDIREAWIDVEGGNAKSVFYNASDAKSKIPGSLDNDVIEFKDVRDNIREVRGVIHLAASENAKVFMVGKNDMLRQMNSSDEAVFIVEEPTVVYVVAEDEPKYMNVNAAQLYEASKTDAHVRRYEILFTYFVCDTKFEFETFDLDKGGKYFLWSDNLPNGKKRAVPNWSTANGGFGLARSSAEIDEYPTIPEKNGYNGWGVKLETCSTGAFGQMTNKPLAAGNLFLGDFDLQTALKEPLTSTHFGVKFNREPIMLTGYYKYFPGKQMTDGKGKNIDGTDEPAIYAILYRNHDKNGNSVLLDGNTVNTSEFIVARAEMKSFKVNTAEWQRFEIPFEYSKEIESDVLDDLGYNITIVCSSSYRGDYYEGAVGSRLYVDEFEIITKEY